MSFTSTTSNVAFRTEEELHEHYRSAFHRYNLKRRVAGLGPVTKEWFELHRDKLMSQANAQNRKENEQVTYYDPLSKKSFNSESKYKEYTNSNKYKKLVKGNGGIRPEPVVKTKTSQPSQQEGQTNENRTTTDEMVSDAQKESSTSGDEYEKMEANDHEDDMDSDSWETASEDEEGEPWDVCTSLFDNHRSKSIEDNIEYMYKNFGFSIPDVESLVDPEGLIEYLGAKLSQGFIPLYSSGLDAEAKSFGSLHAVQRHMVDTGKTRVLYDDNEEEYEDFYDYSTSTEEDIAGRMNTLQLAGTSQQPISNGYELFIPNNNGQGHQRKQKVLGSRTLAKYYKQSHRPSEQRDSVLANKIVARYRMLGLLKMQEENKQIASMNDNEVKRRQNTDDVKLHSGIQNAVIWKLPRNVPY